MPLVRATNILHMQSGEPDDAARNVWHFVTPDLTSDSLTMVGTFLSTFYRALGVYFSPAVSRALNACQVEMAEVTPNLGGPGDDQVSTLLATWSYQMTNGDGTPPEVPEVAVALSFAGDLTGVEEENGLMRPASRRRGRVFLGPFATNVMSRNATTGFVEVSDTFCEAVLDAYDAGHLASEADVGNVPMHVVYSRQNGLTYSVQRLRVDNAPDIQRRRGIKPTFRFQREVTPGLAQTGRTGLESAIPQR